MASPRLRSFILQFTIDQQSWTRNVNIVNEKVKSTVSYYEKWDTSGSATVQSRFGLVEF